MSHLATGCSGGDRSASMILSDAPQVARHSRWRKPVKDGMDELDAAVRNLIPNPIWDKLRRIGYDDELPQLEEWIGKEMSSHQDNVSILFFCLSDMGIVVLEQAMVPADAHSL